MVRYSVTAVVRIVAQYSVGSVFRVVAQYSAVFFCVFPSGSVFGSVCVFPWLGILSFCVIIMCFAMLLGILQFFLCFPVDRYSVVFVFSYGSVFGRYCVSPCGSVFSSVCVFHVARYSVVFCSHLVQESSFQKSDHKLKKEGA